MTIVRLIDLPVSVKAVSAKDEDGNLNVYANARLNLEQQREGVLHEEAHDRLGHFEDPDKAVIVKEDEVETYLKK